MARAALHLLPLSSLLVLLFMPNPSLAKLGPPCLSQFALANRACIALPVVEGSGGPNHVKLREEDDHHGHEHGHGNEHKHGHEHEHEHGHGLGDENEHGHGHGHEHRHGHGHGHGHGEEPQVNKNCCRWLAEVDEACVCEALLRMPPFLVKAKHTYIIKVGKTCKHEYNCGGI
ncbi:zinc transporter SLC39A7-like [Phoenix dactylifera]|uniref:Zinc transporter SLC39A7-like n=1 Tax=Phoenix dactylifera TaxID=42345 RepID=A0A8B7BH82_PHODC|nr:zinc transporter SLC39A7-like [Phoenix dactylifera]